MKIITAQEIRATLKLEDLIEPVRDAFQAFSRGESSDAIAHLHPNGGEVHVKSGFIQGSKVFAVKVSAGFTNNLALGLPVWDGVVMAFDATTGVPVALLQDGGILTDWRTAVAGAISTHALARANTRTLGMVGTGLQGFWQPLAHRAVFEFDRLLLWGRDTGKAEKLKTQLEPHLSDVRIEIRGNLEQLVRQSDAIITATSSTKALIQNDWISTGQHITAVGADNTEKQELDVRILERANVIAVDSLEVNQKYGEVAQALRLEQLHMDRLIELGTLLKNPNLGRRNPQDITVSKLIGLGVQDLAAVNTVLAKIR